MNIDVASLQRVNNHSLQRSFILNYLSKIHLLARLGDYLSQRKQEVSEGPGCASPGVCSGSGLQEQGSADSPTARGMAEPRRCPKALSRLPGASGDIHLTWVLLAPGSISGRRQRDVSLCSIRERWTRCDTEPRGSYSEADPSWAAEPAAFCCYWHLVPHIP